MVAINLTCFVCLLSPLFVTDYRRGKQFSEPVGEDIIMKKAIVTFVIIFAGVFLLREQISVWLFARILENRMDPSATRQLEDGLHVALCGAGSPLPDPERSPPCTLVIAGNKTFLFDAGTTSAAQISQMGFNIGDLDAVFLTHFHSDHLGGLGEVMMQRWIGSSNKSPLPIYGPEGVSDVVDGFNMAYRLDAGYRTAHHGEVVAPQSGTGGIANRFAVPAEGLHPIIKANDVEISAFSVSHNPVSPAVGFLIKYKDRSLVISGDTAQSDNLLNASQSVDLLLHEGLSKRLVKVAEQSARSAGRENLAKIFFDITDYHTDPEDVARIAQQAEVGYLAFTHIVPMLPLPGMEKAFLGAAPDIYDGPIHVGRDGDIISMPVGSDVTTLD